MAVLDTFFTNIANSIRTSSRTTAKIPANQFSNHILNLTNTYGATAAAKDIALGKTAYVNKTQLTGTGYVYGGTSTTAGMYAIFKNVTNLYQMSLSHRNIIGADFYNCTATQAYQLFYQCSNLKEVVNFPSTIVNIDYGFYQCSNLTSITINTSGSSLSAARAFESCPNLTNIYFKNSKVTNLYGAFNYCNKLNYIDIIPSTVTQSSYCFYQVLKNFNIGTLCINNLDTSTPWKSYLKTVNLYKASSGVTAFQSAIALTRVNHVQSVTNAYRMFYQAYNLTYVNFNKSLTTLANASWMFYMVNSLGNNVIGFTNSPQYTFSALSNFDYIFQQVASTSKADRRIGTSLAGAVSGMYAFSSSSNFSTIRLDLINATSANLQFAFQGSNKITTAIINAPKATTVNLYETFNTSFINTVSINLPAVTNLNMYSCFNYYVNIDNIYFNIKNATSPVMTYLFRYRQTGRKLNIFVRNGSTLNTLFYNSGKMNSSIFGSSYNWTLNASNSCYYNATSNIYVYYNLSTLPIS